MISLSGIAAIFLATDSKRASSAFRSVPPPLAVFD
jgi:hypothetical protein